MRFFSILTAVLVMGALYLLVFERDRVTEFAGAPEELAAEEAAPQVDQTVAQADEERVVSVVALRSTAQQIDSAILLRGRTEAARQVTVQSETSGLVRSEPLRKGATIEAGALLCSIDPGTRIASLAEAEARVPEARARLPEAQGRLSEAEARLAEAEINDNAAKQLSEDGFASSTRVASTAAAVQGAKAAVETARAGVEAAKAGVQAAEASLKAAHLEIDKLEITAPFAGLLETDTAELGSLLQPGAPCATIIQLDPIKLVGFVPETEVARVQLGAMAAARTTNGRSLAGDVIFLSRSADPETRTFRVEVRVPNEDLTVRDGQTAEIMISAEGEMAHLVPASALTLNNSGDLGLRVVDSQDGPRAGFKPVRILRDTIDGVWVSGLASEQDIIIVGQEYVTDGVRIDVSYRASAEEVSQ